MRLHIYKKTQKMHGHCMQFIDDGPGCLGGLLLDLRWSLRVILLGISQRKTSQKYELGFFMDFTLLSDIYIYLHIFTYYIYIYIFIYIDIIAILKTWEPGIMCIYIHIYIQWHGHNL